MDLVLPHTMWILAGVIAFVVGPVMVYLSWLTYHARPSAEENQLMALIFLVEGLGTWNIGVNYMFPGHPWVVPVSAVLFSVGVAWLSVAPFAYLAFSGLHRSWLAKPLSWIWARRGLLALGGLLFLYLLFVRWNELAVPRYVEGKQGLGVHFIPLFWTLVAIPLVTNLYLVLVLLHAYFKSEKGTDDKVRLKSYLIGFAFRYFFLVASTGGFLVYKNYFASGGETFSLVATGLAIGGYSLGNGVCAVLFAYGVTSSQVMGIERLFRKTINRAALGSLMVIGFMVTEELLQNVLSTAFGVVGGVGVAGAMALAKDPLMNFIDRGTNSVLPTVVAQGPGVDLYRQQFMAAMDDGEMTNSKRSMLSLSASALNISDEDAARIEEEVLTTMRPTAVAPEVATT